MARNSEKSNSNIWDAVIIGSGLGGLVTASQLAAKGAKVLVLERYKIPGGSGGSFKRKGYIFDVGASMIFGFGEKGYTNLLTRALAEVGERCETIPDPVQLNYHLPNNLQVTVDRNYEKFISDLTELFPNEKSGIKKFYKTCWSVFKCLDSMPLLSIEDPIYLMKVFLKAPLSCLGLARWLPFNVGDVARRYIKDETLLRFLDIECFCWSVMPAERTPMINAGMVFSDRHAGGINYPKGGVGVIAEKLVTGIRKYGGEVRYSSNVKNILIENNKAIGIKMEDDEVIKAKKIISNATRWNTFSEESKDQSLISSNLIPPSERKWRERYTPSPSFLSMHLGVNKDCVENIKHCHHLLLEKWEEMDSEQGVLFVSIPTLLDSSIAPEGKHIVHAFTPSKYEYWVNLNNKEYLAKKEKDSKKLLERLEKIIPGINQSICHKEIGTPKTHKRFLGRFEGSYGPIPAIRLPGLLTMPFNTTSIKNLLCVGDSCFPGQGLNAVAFSGFACAHKIGAQLGINKWELPN